MQWSIKAVCIYMGQPCVVATSHAANFYLVHDVHPLLKPLFTL